MSVNEAWEQLALALRQAKPGCPIVVSPRALAVVIAERGQQEQGDGDERQT